MLPAGESPDRYAHKFRLTASGCVGCKRVADESVADRYLGKGRGRSPPMALGPLKMNDRTSMPTNGAPSIQTGIKELIMIVTSAANAQRAGILALHNRRNTSETPQGRVRLSRIVH